MEGETIVRCDECELPAAKIIGTTIVVECRHHGRTHRTVLDITKVISLVGKEIERQREVLAGRCVE